MHRTLSVLAGTTLLLGSAGVLGAQAAPETAPAAPVDPNAWVIDAGHSELSFRIRHFVSRVRGTFGKWQGSLIADPTNLAAGSVEVTIDAASIDTQNEGRDNDLRSANFFEVEKYPTITFKSTKVAVTGENIEITGDLTMHGVTKPVVLKGRYNGMAKNQRGGDILGFEASATINRLEWGITWNRMVEGMARLGDDVEISIAVQAMKPRPRPAS